MTNLKLSLLATTVLVLAPALPAIAADATPANSAPAAQVSVDEVVVTAQKRAENVQDVPLSITAVAGKTLVAEGVTNVLDLQKMVPNLQFETIAQPAGVTLRIRGIGAASNAAIDPSVAPYVDGAYIPRPGAILTSFLDIDDVEILRGPQGTLFGRNATVGAISLNSVAPSFSGDSGEVSVDLGNYGERKVEGIANLAANDQLAFRLAAFDSHTDGFIHDELDGKTYGRSDTFAGRFSVKAQVTPNLTWTGRVDYADTTGDGISLSQVDTSTATPHQLAAFEARSGLAAVELPGPSYDAWQREDNPSLSDHQVGVNSNLAWDAFDGFSFRLIDSYRSWRNAQTDGDVVFTPLDLLNRHDTFGSDSQSHELQFLSPKDKLLGGRLDFVAGLYYFQEAYSTTEVFDLGTQACNFVYGLAHPGLVAPCLAAPQADAADGVFHQNAESYAGYLQGNFKITDVLTLTLGGRYTQDDKSGQFVQIVRNPYFGTGVLRAPETTSLAFKDSHPSWRADLDWKLTQEVMAFVTYSTGYKSGGFNNNGGAAPLGAANRTFAPETSNDIELGLKSTFFDRRLLLNADLFQTNLDNFQDRSFNGLTFIVRNAGDVRAQGAEFEGAFKPIDHVKLDFGVDYLDSIFTSNTNAPGLPACTATPAAYVPGTNCLAVQNLTGRPTNFAPKWTTDLGLEYDTSAFAGGWTAQLRGTLNYSSKFYTTNDDNPQSIAGGQTLLGARVNVQSPDHSWTFSLYGDNLTDQKYFTLKFAQVLDTAFGVRVPATGATLMRGFMGAPLTFGGRIAKTF